MTKIAPVSSMAIAVFLVLPHILTGCGQQEEILAKIDGKTITVKEFDDRISKLPERYQEVISANKKKFLDEIIVDELLYKEAVRLGYPKDAEVKAVIAEAGKKIMIAKLLKEKIDDVVILEDDMVKEYYDANQDEFATPEILRASHILVKTEDEAKDVLSDLKRDAKFEDLAREHSIDPSSEKGGDIGYFVRGQLDPDFEKACFNLEEGQLSGVVKTKFGYHIVKLTERKPPSIEEYIDVKGRIRQNLVGSRRKQRFTELVTQLRNRAKIVINEEASTLKGSETTGEIDE